MVADRLLRCWPGAVRYGVRCGSVHEFIPDQPGFRRMMENRDGRDLGGNKMGRLLHFRWADFGRALHVAATYTYAIMRALLAGLVISLFWLGLLALKAFSWLFD